MSPKRISPPRDRKRATETSSARPDRPAGTRRRGATLEHALLEAAWEELQSSGYSKLTIERVALLRRVVEALAARGARRPVRGEVADVGVGGLADAGVLSLRPKCFAFDDFTAAFANILGFKGANKTVLVMED